LGGEYILAHLTYLLVLVGAY